MTLQFVSVEYRAEYRQEVIIPIWNMNEKKEGIVDIRGTKNKSILREEVKVVETVAVDNRLDCRCNTGDIYN